MKNIMVIKLILFGIWVLSTLACLHDLFKKDMEAFNDPLEATSFGSSVFVCFCPVINTLACIGGIMNKINPKTREEKIWDEVLYIIINRRVLLSVEEYEKAIRNATNTVDKELREKHKTL